MGETRARNLESCKVMIVVQADSKAGREGCHESRVLAESSG